MKPNIDCHVDSNVTGIWGYEDGQDPTCVRSCIGYIIPIG